MTDKELESKQAVEETTNPAAPQEEQKPDESKLGEDESKIPDESEGEEPKEGQESEKEKEGSQEDEVDYAAELDRVTSSLNKAEHTIVKLKKDKKEQPSIEAQELKEELRAEIVHELEQSVSGVMKKQFEEFRVEDRENYIEDRIREMTNNSVKAELIRKIYVEKLQKSSLTKEAIDADLEYAELLADRPKYISEKNKLSKENRELKESLISKSTLTNTGYGESVKKQKGGYTSTKEDKRISDRYFQGDMERYLKAKKRNEWTTIG